MQRTEVTIDDHIPGLGERPEAPDIVVARRDIAALVTAALDALPARTRAAAYLRWEEGHTFDEIGLALGISGPAAYKLVARAQAQIMPLLADLRNFSEEG